MKFSNFLVGTRNTIMISAIRQFHIAVAILVCLTTVNGYNSKCSENGFKCASCEELIHCVGTQTNGFKVSVINRCDNTKGEYCSVEKGSCVKDSTACRIFGQEKLQCEDVGAFPDPYDCNSYHMCSKTHDTLTSTKHSCPADRAYDPLTATCRFKLTHRVCQSKPVETCVRPLQHGPLEENPNIYFVCVQKDVNDAKLEPLLYKCKAGHVYSEHACTFFCEKPGNFADPHNCYSYFECDSNSKSTHKTCRPGTYFEPKEAICVKGTC